jgi:hypothetical protein
MKPSIAGLSLVQEKRRCLTGFMPETQDRRFQIITIQRYKRDLTFPNFFCNFFIENEAFKVTVEDALEGAVEGVRL